MIGFYSVFLFILLFFFFSLYIFIHIVIANDWTFASALFLICLQNYWDFFSILSNNVQNDTQGNGFVRK